LNRDKLWYCLSILNNILKRNGVCVEVGVYDGVMMFLPLNMLVPIRDVHTIFDNKFDMRAAIKEITDTLKLDPDWFEKSFDSLLEQLENEELPFKMLSHIRIYRVFPQYMLAMKAVSCRPDNQEEVANIRILLKLLNLTTTLDVEKVIYTYYSRKRVPPDSFYEIMKQLGVK